MNKFKGKCKKRAVTDQSANGYKPDFKKPCKNHNKNGLITSESKYQLQLPLDMQRTFPNARNVVINHFPLVLPL